MRFKITDGAHNICKRIRIKMKEGIDGDNVFRVCHWQILMRFELFTPA